MSLPLTRRSLIEGSVAASLGTLLNQLPEAPRRGGSALSQFPAGSFNVREFGAKGDGSTDDSTSFQAAISAAGRVNGIVTVPPSAAPYVIGSSVTLAPNTTIEGAGGQSPTIRFRGYNGAMFMFTGTREAEHLNLILAHLTLESASNGSGVAVRVRNFRDLFLQHVSVNRFNVGVWADWGIGVHLYACAFVRNTRGLQVGGAQGPGGIRAVGRWSHQPDPFMDTVVVDSCDFAQNALDVNDMGSTRSLGGIVIRDSSFYESYSEPVSGKYMYVRFANRKGVTLYGNWFEGAQRSHTCVYLGDFDHDGNQTGICHGAAIFGNHFLQTGPTETIGVDVARCEAAAVFSNCFEFAPGNNPVRLKDSVGKSTIGQNSYLSYPDRVEYANPIGGALNKHQLLDPRLPARLGSELQVGGRVASAVTALSYNTHISTDASVGNFFIIAPNDGKPFTVQDPAKPAAGQQITYDIRNNSGGEMGDITWGSTFRLAGAFGKPADQRRRTITFYYDGVTWVEIARNTTDILS
jgi:pectate lyase-like protein